ncbi:TetR/AcrR family transcriptional regulator [Nitrincola iocasae]|uniref:TetR/AcrR family transcriptional regulator n=1 Tax=Nitrincola iocasae TaxID=2614693 RepID=A0A5J6LK98_9GAMM|nr:TetR/AcrR family transcriptional regulator [Nitrincola iocasae]QEW08421.1 TetR/AcrR family transcriptional regulator [Nitrincola iocasae]
MKTATTTDVRKHILDTAKPIISGKGFVAVGLNEILLAASVPKGSFYHYFKSKEGFGEALLENYFAEYSVQLEAVLTQPGQSAAQRLMRYWQYWIDIEADSNPKGKCLAVKLAAEVSDLSDDMRKVLEQGTDRIIARIARTLEEGIADGSLQPWTESREAAAVLYQLWMGASLRAKITRDRKPLESALVATRRMLGLTD